MHKKIISILGFIFFIFNAAYSLDIKPLPKNMSTSQALYINCLQRTQTQQMLKDYLMVALNSHYKNPEKSLQEGIPLYDKRIHALHEYFLPLLSSHPEEKQQMIEALSLWEKSKTLLESEPSKKNAQRLEKNFLAMVHKLGKAKVLAKNSFKAVGMTGGLCRDPLYMSNTYLMKVWGVDLPDYQGAMEKRIKHFQSNIAKLKSYPGNTAETKKFIHKSENAFLFFTIMYKAKHAIPTLISQKADNIFLYIRTLKKLYASLPH